MTLHLLMSFKYNTNSTVCERKKTVSWTLLKKKKNFCSVEDSVNRIKKQVID